MTQERRKRGWEAWEGGVWALLQGHVEGEKGGLLTQKRGEVEEQEEVEEREAGVRRVGGEEEEGTEGCEEGGGGRKEGEDSVKQEV